MADGLNQARALRIAEIINDFRNIQSSIANIRASPSAEEYNEEGFIILRRCENEAIALLNQPFQSNNVNRSDEEATKTQLRRIIADAAARRHKVQKIYLQATAALRWVTSRAAVLHGQRPHAGHAPALSQIRSALLSELASITDQRIELSLRAADVGAGKWIQEDPPLAIIQRILASGGS